MVAQCRRDYARLRIIRCLTHDVRIHIHSPYPSSFRGVHVCRMYKVMDATHELLHGLAERVAHETDPLYLHFCGLPVIANAEKMTDTAFKIFQEMRSWAPPSSGPVTTFDDVAVLVSKTPQMIMSASDDGRALSELREKYEQVMSERNNFEKLLIEERARVTTLQSYKEQSDAILSLEGAIKSKDAIINTKDQTIDSMKSSLSGLEDLRQQVNELKKEAEGREAKNEDMARTIRTLTNMGYTPQSSKKRSRDDEYSEYGDESEDNDENCTFRCLRGCGGYKRTATAACKNPCFKAPEDYVVPDRLKASSSRSHK